MPKITELWAFVVADTGPEDEGIMAWLPPIGSWMPMVGADPAGMEIFRPIADGISRKCGKPYRIKRFRLVEE